MRRINRLILALLLVAAMALVACNNAAGPTTGGDEAAPEPTTATEEEAAPEPTAAAEESAGAGPVIELAEGDPLRVAFLYVAPIGDLGWTWAHDQARLAIEEEFGDSVETSFVESVPEGPEATRVIRDLASQGNHLIFTTSFGYMDPTVEVAQEFPNTWFVHISGFKTAPNVSTVFGRMENPRYLSGIAAGLATESNVIGYVAAFNIPEVVRGINAFTLGVRSVNPEAEVRVVYTNTWFGPPEEREAAQALLDQGADVITQHQDTTEPQEAAAEAGAVSVGYDSDMREFVGDTVLTSPIWRWEEKYIPIVQAVLDGTYETESYYGTEVVDLAPLSPMVDARAADLIEAQDAAIREGTADVFCGPINSNTGVLVIEEGRCLNDEELLSMQWYVEGVVGEAPAEATEGLGEETDKVPAWTITE